MEEEYTEIEVIKYELVIEGSSADKLLYNFKKKMRKTGKSLMDCISEHKEEKKAKERAKKQEEAKKDLKEGASKFIKVIYRISLIAVFVALIYFFMDRNTIEFLRLKQYYLMGTIVFGIVIGGLVNAFWDNDHNFFVNSILGIIGSVIGVLWTMKIFQGEDYSIFHLLFGIFVATSILFLIFNFIVSFGGLVISLVLAIAFGFSHYEELLILLNKLDQFIMILAISIGFTSLHLWVTTGHLRMRGPFVYTVLISFIGCIFGVLVLNQSMDFRTTVYINSVVCAFVGSAIFLLLTDFIDSQDSSY